MEATLDTTSGVLTKKLSDHQSYCIMLNNVKIRDHPPIYVKINKACGTILCHLELAWGPPKQFHLTAVKYDFL